MRLLNRNRWALLLCAAGAALCLNCFGTKPKPSEPSGGGVSEVAPDAREYVDRARSYFDDNHRDSVIWAASEAIRLAHDGPEAVAAYVIRATVYYEKKNYDQVVHDVSEAIRLSAAYGGDKEAERYLTAAYGLRALAYEEKGNYDLAVEDISAAIQRKPDVAMLYNQRAWLYAHYLKMNFDRAVEDANRAIEIESDEEAYYDTRGWAYLGLGDYDNAEKDFSKALEMDPNLAESKEGIQKVREAREAEPKTEPDK